MNKSDRRERRGSSADTEWPSDGIERVSSCPNCGDDARTLLHDKLTDDTFYTAPGRWTLYGCQRCGCAYLDPRPNAATVGLAYAAYYTHGQPTVALDGRLKALLRVGVNRFADAYVRGVLWQKPLSLTDRVLGAIVAALPPIRETIDAKYRHLRLNKDRLRLLDVGCGDGTFLRRARELGWECEGVDFDPAAVEAARAEGFLVRLGSIDAFAQERDAFDAITCNHVIEHLYEPHALLDALFRLLKPGGRLWLETPNIGSEGFRHFGRHWRGLEPPRHITLFNRESLVAAVQRVGFRVRSGTPWNFKHIRYMFVASRALVLGDVIAPGRGVSAWDQMRVLAVELLIPKRREFVLLRCEKPSTNPPRGTDAHRARSD